jgi:ATP dependent DNA ligase domain
MPPRSDGYIPPCIPTRAYKAPSGPDWVHEIKHDGYRLIVRRERDTVRLFTRRGYDWTGRYPAIALPPSLICWAMAVCDCKCSTARRDGSRDVVRGRKYCLNLRRPSASICEIVPTNEPLEGSLTTPSPKAFSVA